MQSAASIVRTRQLQKWNSIVSSKMRFLKIEENHVLFLHATKGFRRVAKKRLGVA